MFTLRAVQSRYAAQMPLYDGIAMGVLIQPMVSLSGHAYAFIAFSKDAVAKNDQAVYIEMCISECLGHRHFESADCENPERGLKGTSSFGTCK